MPDAHDIRPLLEGHLPRIRNLVARIGPERGLVDDITQECCVRIIEKEHLWRERGKARAWMNAIARNLTFRRIDQRSRERARTESLAEESEQAPGEGAFSEDRVHWVLEQFASLSGKQKEVLKMRYFDGLTNGEIAARMGVAEATVSTHHTRALETLRQRARQRGWLSLFLPWGEWSFAKGALWATAAGVGAMAGSAYFFDTDPETDLIADSSELRRTAIAAHPDAAIEEGKNALYCASFQLAWDAMGREALDGPVRFTEPVPLAEMLGRGGITASDMPARSFVARAGFVRDGIVASIQQELESTFERGPDPYLETLRLTNDDVLAYAFLARELAFAQPFLRLDGKVLFGGRDGVAIEAWGIPSDADLKMSRDALRKAIAQVRVYGYGDYGREPYVVALQPKQKGEEILLARVSPKETLAGTIAAALAIVEENEAQAMETEDQLTVPLVDFDLTHRYAELEGRFLANPGFESYRIGEALQRIRFRLNEEGALLRSRSTMVARGSIPRHFDFTEPHLVMLRKKESKHPYLALWVANPELLVKPD